MEDNFKGKIIYSENYFKTIQEIKSISNSNTGSAARITKQQQIEDLVLNESTIEIITPPNLKLSLDLSDLKNNNFVNNLCSYDESILELNSLEGKVRCITHCVVLQTPSEYIPAAYISLKFFTKSKLIESQATEFSDILFIDDISKATTEEYIKERNFFMNKISPENYYMYIDGSMFSGASTSGNFFMIDHLLSINCRPIFFIKNSESTIIKERFNFAFNYNSDLHWAYAKLKEGEFSDIFAYKSPEGRGKAMCFFKPFHQRSPVRIEFPLNAFLNGLYDQSIFNQIYYQYLANGSSNNMQSRIVQIAENYAREILKSTNIYKEIERMGLTKSMNEERRFN
jgi:hypothetical protein